MLITVVIIVVNIASTPDTSVDSTTTTTDANKFLSILPATTRQIEVINDGLLEEARCQRIKETYSLKLQNKYGHLAAALVNCPGIENEIGIWYMSNNEGSTDIISENSIAKAFSIYPSTNKDLGADREENLLEEFMELKKQQLKMS
jgi:hypothetical protein